MTKWVYGLLTLLLLFAAGCSCTPVEETHYTTLPKIDWAGDDEGPFALAVWDSEGEEVVTEKTYRQGTWRPERDLRFNEEYRMEVIDKDTGEHAMCGLVQIRFQRAKLLFPADQTENHMSIEPELRWQVADHPWPEARYTVQISDRDDFKSVVWERDGVGGPGSEQHYTGVDQISGTEDDIDFVGIECNQPLKAGREYFWRVRVDYFRGKKKIGHGRPSEVWSFFTATQPTGEFVQDIAQLTTDETQDRHPDISVAYDLAYQATTGKSSQVLLKRGKREFNKIIYDPGTEQFSGGDSIDRSPDWDPTGEGIAFSSNRGGSIYRIWHRPTEATGQREITSTNKQDASDPDHSPTGGKIAYVVASPNGKPRIWLVDTDGSKPTLITDGFEPAWANDGQHLAFVRRNASGGRKDAINPYNIFVLDTSSGKGATQITEDGSNRYPTWSPDGKKLAFASNRSGNWDLWETDAAAQEPPRQLTNYLGTDSQPVYAPNGDTIIFSTTRFDNNLDIAMGRIPTR